jgi:hypothetical protein
MTKMISSVPGYNLILIKLLSLVGAIFSSRIQGFQPLFIVGSGRCGSDLLAQILKSHKHITGLTTELNQLWHPNSYPISKARIATPTILQDPKRFTELSIQSWPKDHSATIKRVLTGIYTASSFKPIVFVKSAMLSFMVPELLSIFPSVKIIHLYRNGPSVARSLCKREAMRYPSSFKDENDLMTLCSKYWNACITELDQLNISLSLAKSEKMIEIAYEDLCNDPKDVLSRVAQFLHLQSADFSYNLTLIRESRKVGNYMQNPFWYPYLQVMDTGMKLKGYVNK